MNVEIEGRELLQPEQWSGVDKVIELSKKERIPVPEIVRAFPRWHPVLFSLEGLRLEQRTLWEAAHCDPKAGAFTVSWDGFVRNPQDQVIYRWKIALAPSSRNDKVSHYRPSRCFDAMAWGRAAAMLEQRADRYYEEQRLPLYEEVLREVLGLPSQSVPYMYQGQMHSWRVTENSIWGYNKDELYLANDLTDKERGTLARLGQAAGLNSSLSRKGAELARRIDVHRRKQSACYTAYEGANTALFLYLPRPSYSGHNPFLIELQTLTRRLFFSSQRSQAFSEFGDTALKPELVITPKTKHIVVRIKD